MRLRIWTRVRILKLILGCTDTLFLAKYWCPTRVGYDTGKTRRTPGSEWCPFFFFFFRFSDTVRRFRTGTNKKKKEKEKEEEDEKNWSVTH